MRFLVLSLILGGCSSDAIPPSTVDLGFDACVSCVDAGDNAETGSDAETDLPNDDEDIRYAGFVPLFRFDPYLVGHGFRIVDGVNSRVQLVVAGGTSGFTLEKVLSSELENSTSLEHLTSIPWREGFILTGTSAGVAEFDGELKLTSNLEVYPGTKSLHRFRNQAVVFGGERIGFVESTLLGLSVSKELSLDSADYLNDYAKSFAFGRQVVHEGILYDIAAVENRKTLVGAWDLNASDSESAYLGASETADVHNTRWSASPENQRIFVSSDSTEIAVFTMSSPPTLEQMWDVEHLMLDPTGSFSHTISGDWLILTFRVPGRDDRAYYVLDASATELTCLGKIADGEFNLNGQDQVEFTGIGDEVFVSYGESDIIDNVVNLRSMRRSDFQLVDCDQ
ncbi:hypothetical protein FRD01_14815 [Microvenator marinus]|uniref:Uncharacterized protein n=1 Tax=Microvenator marinus TaxID=2600177 RepID=A0A5B8XS39_9DELT|nr:hypothetical protein [Microvenator marinus]QED28480.1 hypothetical protein FRD01_14815 [Microvenator marinus]